MKKVVEFLVCSLIVFMGMYLLKIFYLDDELEVWQAIVAGIGAGIMSLFIDPIVTAIVKKVLKK